MHKRSRNLSPSIDVLDRRLLLSTDSPISPSPLDYVPFPIVEDISRVTMDLSLGFVPVPIPHTPVDPAN